MTIQAMLDAIVILTNPFVTSLVISTTIYWVYAQRRIRYLEGRLWLRQVGLEQSKKNKKQVNEE